MLTPLRNKLKYILGLFILLLSSLQPAWAGGPPAPSVFSNPLAVILIVLMIILLIVIGVLASILVGAADLKLNKRKLEKSQTGVALRFLLFALCIPAGSAFAQDAGTTTETANAMIGGMPSSTFYVMAVVIFLELALIIVMLINIRLLIKKEKDKLVHVNDEEAAIAKASRLNWWDKLNKFKPVSEEAELDLGHEYDGIRELNNRLPPWWIYGFYLTIVFAGVYLWRFHVSHQGPSSKQEYEISVARAELKIKNYLKTKGDAVDENSVTLLTSADDLGEGKAIFMKSCASCHQENGAGNVGPNLTDDFWLHGHDIKSVFKTIRYGINAMPQWQNSYSNKQLAQVASYIKTLHGTHPPNGKAPQGVEEKEEETKHPVADTAKNNGPKNPVSATKIK